MRRTTRLLPHDRMWTGPQGFVRPHFLSYEEAVKAAVPRPAFTPTRTVNVTDQTSLTNAINNMQAGDLIKNTAVGGFAVSGEYVIAKNPVSTVWIDLGVGANAVRFNYGGTSNLPSIWLNGSSNLTFFGGVVTNPTGGKGVLIYGPATNIAWYDFVIHDCADSGMAVLGVNGNHSGHTFRGEVYSCALVHSIDTHSEQGTGQHCINTADTGTGWTFKNCTVAVYGHDHNGGSVIECGNSDTSEISGNTFYVKANNLTMVALVQTAGNGINLWGNQTIYQVNVPFIQVSNAQGRAVDRNGRQTDSCSGIVVSHGRAHKTNLNTSMNEANPTNPWDTNGTGASPIYNDCKAG